VSKKKIRFSDVSMKDVQEYIPQNVSKNKVIPPVDAKTFVFNVTGQPPPQIAQHNLSFAD
jgi:hypothetical protein